MTLNAHHSLSLSGAARSGPCSRAPGRELPLGWEAGLNNQPSSSTPTELKGHNASTCSQSAPSKVSGVNSHTVLGSKHVCLLSSVHSCKLQKNDFRPFSHSSCVYTKPWSFPEVSCSMECSCPDHHPTPCIQPAPSRGSISRRLGSGTTRLAGVRHTPSLLRFAWVTH